MGFYVEKKLLQRGLTEPIVINGVMRIKPQNQGAAAAGGASLGAGAA